MKKLLALLTVVLFAATGCFSEKGDSTDTKEKVVRATAYTSNYSTMYLRGTCNNWVPTPMTLTANNTWKITAKFGSTTTERFKFDATTTWATNFGDNNNDKIADSNGNDIPVTAGKTYEITFNDITKAYSVSEVVASIRDINIYGNFEGKAAPAGVYGFLTINLVKTTAPDTVVQSGSFYGYDCCKIFRALEPATAYRVIIPSQYSETQKAFFSGEVAFTTTIENKYQPSQALNIIKTPSKISVTVHGPNSNEFYSKTVKLYKASDLTTVLQSAQLAGKEMDVTFKELAPNTKYKAVVDETSGVLQYKGEITFTTNGLNETQPSQMMSITSSVIADKTAYVYTKINAVNFTANPGIDSIARDLKVELYKGSTLVKTSTISGTSIIGVNFSGLERGTPYTLKLPSQNLYVSNPALITGNVKYSATDVTFTMPTDSTQLPNIIWTINAELIPTYAKTYSQIYFRGTPNGWTTTPMSLVADYTWSITVTTGATASESFKFDATTTWATNWGDNNKDFIADASGSNIALAASSTYTITFNDKTKAYTVTKK